MANLQEALQVLLTELESVVEQQKKLDERRRLIEQGIEALSHLLADSSASNPVHVVNATPQADDPALLEGIQGSSFPLWRHIELILDISGPAKPREIADALLSQGYTTTSKDFANVVGTNLRAYPEKFTKLEDGRWQLANPAHGLV